MSNQGKVYFQNRRLTKQVKQLTKDVKARVEAHASDLRMSKQVIDYHHGSISQLRDYQNLLIKQRDDAHARHKSERRWRLAFQTIVAIDVIAYGIHYLCTYLGN